MSPDRDFDQMEQRIGGGGAGGLRVIVWLIIFPVIMIVMAVWAWGAVAGL